jgi:Cd2+/Zn2+-exporting ATPase
MIGNRVNNVVVSVAVDIGITMGVESSSMAMKTSGVAFMSNDIRKIAGAVKIGRRTMKPLLLWI